MQPPRQARALPLGVFQNACALCCDNVVFFRIDSIHLPGPKPVPLGREGTKIVASFFDGGF